MPVQDELRSEEVPLLSSAANVATQDWDFRLMADNLPQMVWTCTPDGECNYLSQRWIEYVGVALEALLGAGWVERVHPDDRLRVVEAWRTCIATGRSFQHDFRIRRHDGAYRWFDTRAQAMRDSLGRVTRWLGSNTDVDDNRRTQAALGESEVRARQIFETNPNAMMVVASDGRIIEANRQAGRVFGYPDGGLLGISVDSLLPIPLRGGHASHRQHYQAAPSPRRMGVGRVLRACRADGTEFPVEVSLGPVTAGGQVSTIVTLADLSELEQTRQALSGSEARFRELYQTSPVAIWQEDWSFLVERVEAQRAAGIDVLARLQEDETWLLDLLHSIRIIDANQWALRMFRADSREALLVCLAGKLDRPELRPALLAQIESRLRGDASYQSEMSLPTADGSTISVLLSMSFPSLGEAHGMVLKSALDITARKQAEAEVLRLNQRLSEQVVERTAQRDLALHDLRQIFGALPSMVGYWDARLCNRFANHAYLEWFDRDPTSMRGMHISEVLGPELFERNRPYIEAALRGETQVFERMIPDPGGGSPRYLWTHYMPDRHEGKVRGFYVLVHDVSRLKQTEAALVAANAELEAFAYAVAHDLRAPLRALNGFSVALQEDCAAEMSPLAREYTDEIARASTHMGRLIDGLLALSRSTRGELALERIDLSALATTICEQLVRIDPERQVQWEVEPGLVGHGDPRMLETVLRNLLENAWKYTSRIERASIRFYAEHSGEHLWFCVADNGAGFNMEHASRLFKPFQRLHRQDEFAGTGIGLASVLRIVRRHGGDVEARAEAGQGACFRFRLGGLKSAEEGEA